MDTGNLTTIGMLTNALIVLCTIICIYIAYRSYSNAQKGYMDNGAQYATTFGVLFTFLGVAIALWHFDANGSVETIKDGIMILVDGMRLAFITSIIGMMTGIMIRWLIQSGLEKTAEEKSSKDIETIARNSERLTVLKEITKDIFVCAKENKNSINEKLDQLIRLENESQNAMNAYFKERIKLEKESPLHRYISELMALQKVYIKLSEENNVHLNTLVKDSNIYAQLLSSIQDLEERIDHLGSASQKNLDRQMAELFGDHLEELNASISTLLEWQNGYKETIENTVSELHFINSIFSQFASDIMPSFTENTSKLQKNMQSFTDTSEKNAEIQAQLLNTAKQLEHAMEALQSTCSAFDEFNKKVIASMNESMNHIARRPSKKRRN